METTKVPHIKKEAVLPINIGTAYISRLNELAHFLIANKTAEEMQQYKDLSEANKPLEGWMYHLMTVMMLLGEAYKIAAKEDLLEFKVMVIPGVDD